LPQKLLLPSHSQNVKRTTEKPKTKASGLFLKGTELHRKLACLTQPDLLQAQESLFFEPLAKPKKATVHLQPASTGSDPKLKISAKNF